MTELPTNYIKFCAEETSILFPSNGALALDQLQALLDDRDFWRQTATDLEQSIQYGIRDNEKLGYVLCAAIRGFNDAVDARRGDKQ